MNNIGKKIMIIGSPGSGKSTFSKKLAEITGIPLITLIRNFGTMVGLKPPGMNG